MLIGSHISAAGGVKNAPQNSHKIGGEVFQFFSRSPRGGKAPELTAEIIKEFQNNMKKYDQKECYTHAPYFINLASSNPRIYHSSISILREELERSTKLGVKYLMTHLGSAKDLGEEETLKKIAAGIADILKNYQGTTMFLMEISAGTGMIIGDRFEDIQNIIKNLNLKIRNSLGICFDTAHAFASGYDLRTKETVKTVFDEFDKIIGLKYLKLIHANDSKTELASRKDRHADIGHGKIGLEGFKALINEPRLKNINFILETPTEKLNIENINILKGFRDK